MRNIALILKEPVDQDSLKKAVESLGGYWMTMPTKPDFEQGVFERGRAAVIVSHCADIKERSYDYGPEELEFLRRQLGVEPRVMVDLAIRRNPESNELMRELVEKFIQLWGGYLDEEE